MKLMNSETHSCTHSFASLAIYEERNMKNLGITLCINFSFSNWNEIKHQLYSQNQRLTLACFPWDYLCRKHFNEWLNGKQLYKRTFTSLHENNLVIYLELYKAPMLLISSDEILIIRYCLFYIHTFPVSGMAFFMIRATFAIGKNLSYNFQMTCNMVKFSAFPGI